MIRRWPLWVLLALLWMILQDSYRLDNFIAGLIVGALVFWLTPAPEIDFIRPKYKGVAGFFPWLPKLVRMVLVFIWELLKSNWAVAVMTLKPDLKLTPGILAMPLRVRQPGQIATVANMITLTPGTISVDVNKENTVLFIHCIDASDPESALASCYLFEDLVLEVLE